MVYGVCRYVLRMYNNMYNSCQHSSADPGFTPGESADFGPHIYIWTPLQIPTPDPDPEPRIQGLAPQNGLF